jgi:endonuclease/exonuclease/phosphatase family metal-dependent hydrolase
VRRNTIRGAVPGSPAATRPAPGGQSWPIRRGLILEILRGEWPDVAGLQEVRAHPRVEAGLSAVHQLARPLGWNVLFAEGDGPSAPDEGVRGLAIVSPHPLRELARIPLPDAEGRDTYLCLACEVSTPAGPLTFLTTHFALAAPVSEDRAHQEESVRRNLAFCRTLPPGMPLVLTGDLNVTPELRPIRALLEEQGGGVAPGGFQDASVRATGGALATMPSHAPLEQLDYIFVAHADVEVCRTVGLPTPDGYFPSDHLGLVADLRFLPGR